MEKVKKFAVVDGFLTKLESSPRTSDSRIFVESIFPTVFGTAAMESFMESQESYLALFEDQVNKAAHVNVLCPRKKHHPAIRVLS